LVAAFFSGVELPANHSSAPSDFQYPNIQSVSASIAHSVIPASTRWPWLSILSTTVAAFREAVLPLSAIYLPADRKNEPCVFCGLYETGYGAKSFLGRAMNQVADEEFDSDNASQGESYG
jgi:hypothetical protein